MEKRKKDFVLMLILTVLAYIVSMVIINENYPYPFPPKEWVFIMMIATTGTLYFLLYRVTSNYVASKVFRFSYIGMLVIRFACTAYSARRGVTISEVMLPATVGYLMGFISNSIIFYLIVKDMFAAKHDMNYSLLAATCAYLLIPTIFGYIFALFALQTPALLSADSSNIQDLIQKAFETGYFLAAGMDVPGINSIIKAIGGIESFMVSLYIVFVVGRLMVSIKE